MSVLPPAPAGPPAWLLVALGGALGACARFGLGGWVAQAATARGWPQVLGLPLGTWVINVAGCLAIGLIAALAGGRPAWVPPEGRLLLAVGFCGAFTTFSTFGLEAVTLFGQGRWLQAALYVLASNAGGLAAVAVGLALGRAAAG
ncbi:MAG: fluoride efflux transporter CrcB [Candidatus Sericytochromatia bacterium]|nr:fluoride efflux transporter CrcB [Candidatus Sericytochromatia bacterium]